MRRVHAILEWLKHRWRTNFNLFDTYLREVANHWNEYVWDVLAPTSPFILWWMLGSPPVIVVVMVFVWALLIAGYYTWRADHLRLTPGIKLEDIRQQPAAAKDGTCTYIQLVIACATEASIEECKGNLLRVWRWSNNNWEQIEPNQPLRLNWSPGKDEPRSVFPGVPQLIDVLFISDRVSYLSFCSDWVPQRAKTIDVGQPSLLKFEVAITGKDADSHKSLPTLLISFQVSIQRWPAIDSIKQL